MASCVTQVSPKTPAVWQHQCQGTLRSESTFSWAMGSLSLRPVWISILHVVGAHNYVN